MRPMVLILLLILAFCAAIYLLSDVILKIASEKMIDYIMMKVRIHDIEFTRPSFISVELTDFNTITWHGISADIKLVKDEVNREFTDFTATIEKFSIKLDKLPGRFIEMDVLGLSAERKMPEKTASDLIGLPGDLLKADNIKIQIRLNSLSPANLSNEIRGIVNELKNFMQDGKTTIPIQFSGKERFVIGGRLREAKVWIKREGDEYRLVMDEDDLKRMGALGGKIPPTSADIKLIADNPLKAPELFRIRNKAEAIAAAAHQEDPAVPEDAYRHILWSYLLTKRFSEKFAKEVGDAHEAEPDAEEADPRSSESFSASQKQDYNNNSVGRSYALKGYPESNILKNVMTDPAVIRD